MVKVEIGTVIPKGTIRQGQTREARIWLFGTVNAEKGYDRIQVWATNAERICAMDCDFKVAEIYGASLSNRKYTSKTGEEKWGTTYSVNAKLEPCSSDMQPSNEDIQAAVPVGFSKIDSEDIPF